MEKLISTIMELITQNLKFKYKKKIDEENNNLYLYIQLQQENIYNTYHDLKNHLITMKILENESDITTKQEYKAKIKQSYDKIYNGYYSGDAILDIIIQYYRNKNIDIVEAKISDNNYLELIGILNEFLGEKCKVKINNHEIMISSKSISKEKTFNIDDKYPSYRIYQVK